MKISLALFLLIGVANCQELFKPGRPLVGRKISSRSAATVENFCVEADNANKKYCNGINNSAPPAPDVCESDGLWICDETGKNGTKLTCGGDFGYCVEPTPGGAKCQGTPSPGCEPEIPPFFCTGVGVFPDSSDCKKYYNCYKNETTKALKYQALGCENLYVFDPSGPGDNYCRLTFNKYCTIVACNGAFKNFVMTYTWFPKSKGQYITSCQGNQPSLVYRCGAGFEADLKTSPVECNYICRGSEKAVYDLDDTKYYQCYYNGAKYVPKLTDCLIPLRFNPKYKKCEVKPTERPTQAPTTKASTTTIAKSTTQASSTVTALKTTAEPETESTKQTTAEPTTETSAGTTAESATETTAESATETTTESATETTAERTTETTAESETETTAESATETTTESATETT